MPLGAVTHTELVNCSYEHPGGSNGGGRNVPSALLAMRSSEGILAGSTG